MKFRDDIKPLHVVQPEGVSFKMDGNVLEWQKWKMHIGGSAPLPSSARPRAHVEALAHLQRSTIARASRSRRSPTTTMA